MLCVYLNLQAIKREPLQKQIFLDISHTHTQKCFQFNRENVRYCYLDYIYLIWVDPHCCRYHYTCTNVMIWYVEKLQKTIPALNIKMKNIQIPSALSPTHDFHNELPTWVFIVLKCQFSKNISKVVWDTSMLWRTIYWNNQ